MEVAKRNFATSAFVPASSPQRSLPEQIADVVGREILEGKITDGQRLMEQELANRFDVSRGPAREAVRLLERRGMVKVEARRGSFAIGHTANMIADVFNLRAALLGLAARSFVRYCDRQAVAELDAAIDRAERMETDPPVDPVAFALRSGDVATVLRQRSGNSYLVKAVMITESDSVWTYFWQRPYDYRDPTRRAEVVGQWRQIVQAARVGDELLAERVAQQLLFDTRDHVLAQIIAQRDGEEVSAHRCMTNGSLLSSTS
jgi:DNA-binding GntR family transcriptional regulator